MSELENDHAKPALSGLVLGTDTQVTRLQARSIALFAFKTSVVFDHLKRGTSPFFPFSNRQRFAKSLVIPLNVGIWIAAYLPMGKGEVHTTYHEGVLKENQIRIFVCTYVVGHLAFQLAAVRQMDVKPIASNGGFEPVLLSVWPNQKLSAWPLDRILMNTDEFDALSLRWGQIQVKK